MAARSTQVLPSSSQMVVVACPRHNHSIYMPQALFFTILTHLDVRSLTRCSEVNRGWRAIAQNERLWKSLFPHILSTELIRQYLANHAMRGSRLEDIAILARRFFDGIRPGYNASFVCLFTASPHYAVSISLGTSTSDPHSANTPTNQMYVVYPKAIPNAVLHEECGHRRNIGISHYSMRIRLPKDAMQFRELNEYVERRVAALEQRMQRIQCFHKIKNAVMIAGVVGISILVKIYSNRIISDGS